MNQQIVEQLSVTTGAQIRALVTDSQDQYMAALQYAEAHDPDERNVIAIELVRLSVLIEGLRNEAGMAQSLAAILHHVSRLETAVDNASRDRLMWSNDAANQKTRADENEAKANEALNEARRIKNSWRHIVPLATQAQEWMGQRYKNPPEPLNELLEYITSRADV